MLRRTDRSAECLHNLARERSPEGAPDDRRLSPDLRKAERVLTERDASRLLPSGAYAPNLLGLSDHIPARIAYLTEGPSSAGLPPPVEAARKPILIRSIPCLRRQDDPRPIKLLQAVPEHGTISLLENPSAYVHRVVRADAQDVSIVGSMVDLAEGEAVLNYWDASSFVVGNDMRRIEELHMP